MGAKTEIYADTSSLLDWAFQQASACTAVGQGTRAAGGG